VLYLFRNALVAGLLFGVSWGITLTMKSWLVIPVVAHFGAHL
jgi:hypothetical protein